VQVRGATPRRAKKRPDSTVAPPNRCLLSLPQTLCDRRSSWEMHSPNTVPDPILSSHLLGILNGRAQGCGPAPSHWRNWILEPSRI